MISDRTLEEDFISNFLLVTVRGQGAGWGTKRVAFHNQHVIHHHSSLIFHTTTQPKKTTLLRLSTVIFTPSNAPNPHTTIGTLSRRLRRHVLEDTYLYSLRVVNHSPWTGAVSIDRNKGRKKTVVVNQSFAGRTE